MPAVLRLIVLVPLGYLAAVLVAATVVVVGVLGPFEPGFVPYFAFPFAAAITMTGAAALVPAAVAIAAAEVFRLRSVLFYLAVGGALGLAFAGLSDFHGSAELIARRPVLYPAAGLAGAFVYWLIAGRLAGRVRPPPRP